MKNAIKVFAGIAAVLVVGWIIFQLGTLVAADQVSLRDRDDLHDKLDEQAAVVERQQAALDEVNRRCVVADDCTPVSAPDVDDLEVQDGEIQEPEIQEPEVQNPERQDPEVDDAPVPGAAGSDGAQGPQGPQGPAGPAGQDGADGKDGAPGTAQPGLYSCGDGEYLNGITIAADGSVTLACQPLPTNPGNPGGAE